VREEEAEEEAVRRGRAIAAAAVALATLGAGAASASTTVPNPAVPLSGTGDDINDPQVAVGPSGNAFFAWIRDEPGPGTNKWLQVARVSSDGVVGPVVTPSVISESSSSPDVAASPDGTAIAVWQEFQPGSSDRYIRSVRFLLTSGAGVIQTVSNTSNDVTDPDVSIDGTGTAHIVWTNLDGDDTIEHRTRSASEVQGSIETVADFTGADFSEPHVAAGADGKAVIAYRGEAGTQDLVLYKRRTGVNTYNDGDEGIQVSAATPGDTRDQSQVALEPGGDAVVTWREDVGTTNQIKARRIESSENGPSAAVKDISDAGQSADQPQVDLDQSGDAYLTWRRSNGTNTVAQERTMSPASVLGTTENLAGGGGTNADQPQVAVDSAGNATFAWRFGLNVETRGLTAVGTLLPTQPLTSSGSNTEPRVDANASGARWGAYRVDTAGNDQAFMFFDPTAPGFVRPDPPADPAAPAAPKKCKKGRKLKKGKCVKKKRRKRR
jgi:hypothetical protein